MLGGWGNVRLSDGRIRSRMIAARFTDLGGLDTTFTSNGFSVDQIAGEGFYETHALFYDPQRKTILAGGFARPDSQSSLGDQFAFIRYSDSGFPDTLFNGTGRMLQNLTPQADHVNAIVSEVGGTLVAGGSANDTTRAARPRRLPRRRGPAGARPARRDPLASPPRRSGAGSESASVSL